MSSQSLLKQSPVSEDEEDGQKVSTQPPLGARTCLSTPILDRKEELRAYGIAKDNDYGLSGTGQGNEKSNTTIGKSAKKQGSQGRGKMGNNHME